MTAEEIEKLARNVLHHGWGWHEDLKRLEEAALDGIRCEKRLVELETENHQLMSRIIELQAA